MKILYIIPVIILVLFLPAFGYASLYGDTYYSYTQSGKEGYVLGLGISVFYDLPFDVKINKVMWYSATSLSYGKQDADTPWNTTIFVLPITAGVYLDHTFTTYPCKVGGGLGGGAVYIRKYTPKHYGPYMDISQTEVHNAVGPRVEALVGVEYIITQRVSFFVRVGYQLTWCDEDYIAERVHGGMIHCGLQWTLQGLNKGLFDE